MVGDGNGIARLDGQLRLIGACVADTLHHVLAGCVEDILVGHIAHGLAVDLHSQRVGLVDDIFKHHAAQRQRTDRQDVHRHPGQQPEVAADAASEIVGAGLQCRAKALFSVDLVGVDEKGHYALHEQHKGAEQILDDLCRTRESRLGQVFCKAADAPDAQEGQVLDASPGTHRSILCTKAQCIEHCADACRQRRSPQLLGCAVQPMAAEAEAPVAAQQTDALELRPS